MPLCCGKYGNSNAIETNNENKWKLFAFFILKYLIKNCLFLCTKYL